MTYCPRTATILAVIALLIWAPPSRPAAGGDKEAGDAIPFHVFARFERIPKGNPVFHCEPPEWAAAAHAIVVEDTVHYLWARRKVDNYWVLMHSTAPVSDPASVTKDPANPIFEGSGRSWDSRGVREAEIFKGPKYYHVFYGGSDGEVWRVGHVRTRDFRSFEPNPANPIFHPSSEPDAWDSDGILTPQVLEIGDFYYMLYAGMKGKEWQSGLARAGKPEGY